MGHLFVMSWVRVRRVALGYSFGIMYVEWYGVCNFVVFSVVDVLTYRVWFCKTVTYTTIGHYSQPRIRFPLFKFEIVYTSRFATTGLSVCMILCDVP